ncbi:MAG: MFS transporter [Magnetococcales bacterium]|nr:MFS transporter [Magnetococcales bacterium]
MREGGVRPRLARWGHFLALRRETVGLLSLVILIGMGERLGERFLPLYLLALGAGPLVIGLLGGMENLLSAFYSLPGGYLAERLGVRRSLLWINLLAIVGYLWVILVPHWWAVLVGAVLFSAWSALSLPASMGLMAKVLPSKQRTMGVTMHALVKRLPMALGPLLGGVCIDRLGVVAGVRFSFGIALLLALLGIIVQQRLLPDDRPSVADRPPATLIGLLALITPGMRRLLIADILIRFCEQIPYAFVVVWCTTGVAHPVSASAFGLLTAIEMGTAILIYLPVAWLADRAAKGPFVLITFLFFTLFPLLLLWADSWEMLVIAFIVRGLKEFGEPTRKALILDLAPPQHQATAFGGYYLVRDSVVALGALAGAFLWQLGPQVNFLVAAAFGGVGSLWFLLRGEGRG